MWRAEFGNFDYNIKHLPGRSKATNVRQTITTDPKPENEELSNPLYQQ